MSAPDLSEVLSVAAHEAEQLGHSFIGPEHLLIAATRQASPTAQAVLDRHNLQPHILRAAVDEILGPELRSPAPSAARHPSLRAQRALDRARRELGGGGASADILLVALLADDVAENGVVGTVVERQSTARSTLRAELLASGSLDRPSNER